MKKREYILLKLIEDYIRRPEPVSSRRLQDALDIDISSATIRYYFKQLTEEGALQKSHASSGRVPTLASLQTFWRSKLREDLELPLRDETQLECLARAKGIFCEYYTLEDAPLEGFEPVGDMLLVRFGGRKMAVERSEPLERYLRRQMGRGAFDLARDSYRVGLVRFGKGVRDLMRRRFRVCALAEVIDISKEDIRWAERNLQRLLDGSAIYEGESGVAFEGGVVRYKFRIAAGDERGEMLLLGRPHKDFLGFVNRLKGA